MSATSISRIQTDEIRASLAQVLARYFEFPRRIGRLTRRRSAYSSSYALENLEVELDGVDTVRLVMKDVRDAMAAILDGTSLADVLERIEAARVKEKGVLHYSI